MRSSNSRGDRSNVTRPDTTFPTAVERVTRVIAAGTPAIGQTVERALPTPHVLKVLADEVRKAVASPKSVAHPELADPDAFWRQSAFPQASAMVRQLRAVLVELATELAPVVEASRPDFETWLRGLALGDLRARRDDPVAARAKAIDQIAGRCGELHKVIATASSLVPEATRLEELRAGLAQGRRKQAESLAKQEQCSVEQADARLRAEPPHRHQDLLLDAFEMALATLRTDVEAMVAQLTAPIFGLGEQMVISYGAVVLELDANPGMPIAPLAG